MLDFETGMIGLPLRLLAREVYDRVTTRVGEAKVALITGEEKRVPESPAYWICTVEAMPISREVEFVAIDEVQLAAHPQRGHVFTDRLLHLRGTKETWFLGSDTMNEVVRTLTPAAEIASHPRLSSLGYTGAVPLTRVPPRSAIVAFSMTEVYTLAERIRTSKGGAAVVLGALSPRTRNAQVAMFQSGEVDYLVATDAIGMGLNLDVAHIAFTALDKFDGRRVRQLETAELGQIAGRAGRFLKNGTFGTVAPLAIPPWAAREIEDQRFASATRVFWRAHTLDFSSKAALLACLRSRPPSGPLIPVSEAEDTAAFIALTRNDRVAASTPAELKLLWDVCGVPDFRKLLFEAHVDDLADIYRAILENGGTIPSEWMEKRIARSEDRSGDVETLTARLAALRTWAYVANHGDWVKDSATWQARTREAEDALSDTLHEALLHRFVAKKRTRATPKNAFSGLQTLRDQLAQKASGTASHEEWEALVDGAAERFEIDTAGRIHATLGGKMVTLASLVKGRVPTQPELRMETLPIPAGVNQRLQRRLLAHVRDMTTALLAPLSSLAKSDSSTVRALGFALERGLGTAEDIPVLTERDREMTRKMDVVIVRHGARVSAFVKSMHSESSLSLRRALATTYSDHPPAIQLGELTLGRLRLRADLVPSLRTLEDIGRVLQVDETLAQAYAAQLWSRPAQGPRARRR
jgi:ATP-dependent RNA helicase SUPV3L1/SUV3